MILHSRSYRFSSNTRTVANKSCPWHPQDTESTHQRPVKFLLRCPLHHPLQLCTCDPIIFAPCHIQYLLQPRSPGPIQLLDAGAVKTPSCTSSTLLRWRPSSRSNFQDVSVTFGAVDSAMLLLIAYFGAQHPFVFEDFFHARSFGWVNLEHSSNDVTTFARKDSEKSPGPFDDFPFVASRSRRTWLIHALGMVVMMGTAAVRFRAFLIAGT